MKCSLILCCYNRKNIVSSAIQSVIDQDCRDFELVFIDDGSEENLYSLWREMENKMDFSHTYIRIKNDGTCSVSKAANAGLRIARGKYIAYLASDDILTSNSISCRVSFLDAHPDIYVVAAKRHVRGENLRDWEKYDGNWTKRFGTDKLSIDEAKRQQIKKNIIGCGTAMWRRECTSIIGFFNENRKHAEECDYWNRMVENNLPVQFLNEYVYIIRKHSGSKSRGKRNAKKY